MNHDLTVIFAVTAAVLLAAWLLGRIAARHARPANASTIENFNQRVGAWWWMIVVVAASVGAGWGGAVVLFAAISFLALREFLTLVNTDRADHRTLLAIFFIVTPCHYYFIYRGWYGLFSIFIPVWAFVLVPISAALRGGPRNFMARVSEMQWALIICVYFISYAPALAGLPELSRKGPNFGLALYLMLVTQVSDVLQYAFGHLFGKHAMAPAVSPHKTWEGFAGGVVCATALGVALRRLTPFALVPSIIISLVVCLTGVAGGLTMSAIKRDCGVKDFSSLIPGHGGILDRVDSICFAGPVLFHVTRFFYG